MVHWDRKAFRKQLIVQIAVLLALMVAVSLFYEHSRKLIGSESNLTILAKEKIPLKEISGLALMPDGNSLAIIGDNDAKILLHDLRSVVEGQSLPFHNQLVERFSLCQEEDFEECSKSIQKLTRNWEAIAVAGDGRYYILQEHSQSILVMDPSAKVIEHVLHFNFAKAFPDILSRGSKKVSKNSLGEGLLLLKNGHIIVAKEGFPMALVEFGPEGDQARGINSETVLRAGEPFSMLAPETELHVRLHPLHTWLIAAQEKCDISDIALSAKQELMILSEKCKTISIAPQLLPSQDLTLSKVFHLPEEIPHPEALAAFGEQWIVAGDLSSKKRYNYYILKP